jgi:hypothetical protein
VGRGQGACASGRAPQRAGGGGRRRQRGARRSPRPQPVPTPRALARAHLSPAAAAAAAAATAARAPPRPQACSAPFAAALSPGAPPGEDLPVTGVDSDALEAVVRFCYEGRLLLTPRNAAAVVDAAARLQVVPLADAGRAYARGALGPRTAMGLLMDALRFDIHGLVDEALACVVLQ